jgi:homocitrate synthase NifV
MIKIVDTTLRDGEQRAGIALGVKEKIFIAKKLNFLEIYQIEAGIPAMGGNEKRSVEVIANLGLRSKISAWNRMNIHDIDESISCKVDIIHISIPSSDIQIIKKMGKNHTWILSKMKECIIHTKDKGFEVVIGLEDASRADMEFLIEIIGECLLEGINRFRYADTVGILNRQKTYDDFKKIIDTHNVELEMHAHNDLGMAVSNSIIALEAGANFINCTISGIGERAGNCDYLKFIEVMNNLDYEVSNKDIEIIYNTQNKILKVINSKN